jgi:hypothetical protein
VESEEGRKSGSSSNDNGYEIVDPEEFEGEEKSSSESPKAAEVTSIAAEKSSTAVRQRCGKKGGKPRQA